MAIIHSVAHESPVTTSLLVGVGVGAISVAMGDVDPVSVSFKMLGGALATRVILWVDSDPAPTVAAAPVAIAPAATPVAIDATVAAMVKAAVDAQVAAAVAASAAVARAAAATAAANAALTPPPAAAAAAV